ncbi:MAG: Crp/Fnr family transcriptional regulator [Chitinophagales bacterium]
MDTFKKYMLTNAGITDKEFDVLSEKLLHKNIEKGEFVLNQGDVCHHSFFVNSGLLRAYTIDESGKEHIIQFASENWIISDRSSAFFNEPSELYIDAIEDTSAVLFDTDFISLANEISTTFRKYNEKLLQNHIRQQQKRINLLISATAEQRYLNFIQLYPDLTLRVPQWMIASYLGITPESLSRVRKELSNRNFQK